MGVGGWRGSGVQEDGQRELRWESDSLGLPLALPHARCVVLRVSELQVPYLQSWGKAYTFPENLRV